MEPSAKVSNFAQTRLENLFNLLAYLALTVGSLAARVEHSEFWPHFRRYQMTIQGSDALLVGPGFRSFQALADRMRLWGFRCHFAETVRTAQELVNKTRVDLVLSSVFLPDGTGYTLLASLSGLPVTAFLCLPVEESCYWLPAIDDGIDCLGLPALRPSEFVDRLEEMARSLSAEPQVN
jgi:hypothetical protein